ncbi:MAG: EAL domain-containing protein [Candidatus Thiodiazotropha sp.]
MTQTDLTRLNRELKAISSWNQSVMRARDEFVFLEDACEVVCRDLEYPMAWVIYPQTDSPDSWRVVACAGREEILSGCREFIGQDGVLSEESFCPVAQDSATVATHDWSADWQSEAWQIFANSYDIHASINLPLRDPQQQLFGWLLVFSADYRVFAGGERRLIEQFSEDLAFGVHYLRLQRAHHEAQQELLSNLHYFKDMDRVNRAIQQGTDLQQMVNETLEIVLQVFSCERACLMFPCDPNAVSWQTSMQRTRVEYPDVVAPGIEVMMTSEVSNIFRILLNAEGPVQFGPNAQHPLPQQVATRFDLKAMMAMALYPRVGKPWHFGIHQCESEHLWSNDEVRLFNEIGLRLTDGLTSMLTLDELRESQRKLTESENQYHTLVDNLPDCIARFDRQGNVVFVNKASMEAFGLSETDTLGKSLENNGPGTQQENAMLNDLVRKVFEEGVVNQVEATWQTRQGLRYFDVMHLPERDSQGRVVSVLGVGHDVTDRKQQQKQLLYQAHYDQLTGLPNRFLALDRLEQNIKQAERGSAQTGLIFLDLDDFKKINDGLGHEVGDEVLKLAAERLRKAVRDSDTVARLGGDEFVVLVQDVRHAGSVRAVAEKILQAFQNVFKVMDRRIMITTSLGIALYPVDGDDAFTLLRNADTAMYYSKVMGRNAYHFFTEAMNQNVARRLLMEEQLRVALEKDEMHLVYQPIVSLADGRIVAVEALLRWHNELLGQLPTQEVIDLAEQTGLIVPIGSWVIRTALHDLRGWNFDSEDRFRLSLNVSPSQFRHARFLKLLESALEEEGVHGDQMQLEITEGLLLGGEVGAGEVIDRLHQLGVKLAMDDFGTGYSSLNYLRKYRFDAIKIERGFVRDVVNDENDRVLVTAILRMARGLGVEVVAEGIETQEQLQFLQMESCDLAQGFFLCEPQDAQSVGHLLRRDKMRISSIPDTGSYRT